MPLKKPVAGVRVGLLPGETEPILNPTSEQMSRSRLDLVLAGTEDAVMMIEGFGDFLTVDEMLYAIEKGHEAVANACREIEAWAKEVGRDKATEKMLETPDGVDEAVEAAVGVELAEAMAIGQKQVRGAAVEKVRNKAMEELEGELFGARRALGTRRHPRRSDPVSLLFLSRRDRSFTSVFVAFFPTDNNRAHSPKGSPSRSTRGAEGDGLNCRGRRLHATSTSNARSAHPGVAPGNFRCRRFARTRHLADPTRGASAHSERLARSLDHSRPSLCGSILSLCSLVSRGARLGVDWTL